MQALGSFGVQISEMPSSHQLIELVKQHSLVLLRDFIMPTKDEFLDYAKSLGSLLEWDTGPVMEMKVHEQPKNYLFTSGQVPLHWDGAFHKVPSFLLFHCIEAPLSNCGGETIFSNTQQVWQAANSAERELWSQIQLTYKTEKLAHYGGSITVPMVQVHPHTGKPTLRFAEPVPATMLNPVEAIVEGFDTAQSQQFFKDMAERFYHPQCCYTHRWQTNDFLIVDNHALLHGRREFTAFTPRHLRRIQVI